MLIDALGKYIFNADTFHRFSFFLGTEKGELLKRFIELIFFAIILYMIVSEFRKNRKREYKYLIVGFLALLFRQIVMCSILFTKVFGVYEFARFGVFIAFIDAYLEIIALLLLVAAFIFPAFKERTFRFQRNVLSLLVILSLATIGDYLLFKQGFISAGYEKAILDAILIFVLILPFFFLIRGRYKRIRHLKSILFAFFIYMLIPLTDFISILLAGNVDARIRVMQHPLPFVSILLLMRSVYLTLVDKAFLTDRLRKSEKMLKYQKELNKLKDHFISIVSHELRTPITSMKLYLSLLRKGKFGKISGKQSRAVKTVIDENNRLRDLINNLLTINRIEANKLDMEREDFELGEIIDDMYISFARNKGIKVVNKAAKVRVNGDKKLLKQVFINLMNNAIKFSKKGGRITIDGGKKDKKWWLSVKDEGIGIKKEETPKLFNKFYQVDNQVMKQNQGIGLGLAIVKHIVEMHNGKIEVNSSPGKGAEFKVWIG
ncbi:hypothetical protein GF323_01075 [Candidatus Woesearchaeota archaeon]|nr:hypothetical protein [Candidatus Woesearchaeota archaeon]